MGPALLGHPERDHKLFQSRTPQQRTLRAEATAAAIYQWQEIIVAAGARKSPEMGGLWAKNSYPNTKLLFALKIVSQKEEGEPMKERNSLDVEFNI